MRELVDQQCELNNEKKLRRWLLINCEKKVNETPDIKYHENSVCINLPPLIENRLSNIPDITDSKTSTNRNTSTKTSNQRENSITKTSKNY